SLGRLGGAGEQALRPGESERLAGVQVNHQLVLGWSLHRQVSWLLTLEDAVDVPGRAPVLVTLIGAIGDQAAGLDEVAERIDRGQLVPSRQRSDPIGMVRGESVWGDDQPTVRAIRQCCNVALDLADIVDVDHAQFNADRCERLDRGKLADSGYGGFA